MTIIQNFLVVRMTIEKTPYHSHFIFIAMILMNYKALLSFFKTILSCYKLLFCYPKYFIFLFISSIQKNLLNCFISNLKIMSEFSSLKFQNIKNILKWKKLMRVKIKFLQSDLILLNFFLFIEKFLVNACNYTILTIFLIKLHLEQKKS